MKYSIKNIAWITCVFAPMSNSWSVTIEVMAKAGSIYETRETNGISHFLEHMFFKGGEKYPTPKSVAEAVDSFGWEFNAYTGDDYAGYYVKAAPQFTDKAIDVLADMMLHARFPKAEMEREKDVVIQEIMMYEDNPARLVMDKWKHYYYGDNSYGWATLGPVENIKSFTQEHLFAHKEQLYTKDNIIIIVAGNIDNQNIIEQQIGELFDQLPVSTTAIKPWYPHYKPKENFGFYDKWTQQNHLIISAEWFAENAIEKYAANILATILGGNMSSRLFQNIREKQWLCYYINARHYTSPDDGVFVIRAWIDKERFDFGLEKIYAEIADIAVWNFDEQEFTNAINATIWWLQIGIETSDDVSTFLGMQQLLYNDIISLEQQVNEYRKVSYGQVKNVAKNLLNENLYLYYIK